MLMGKWSLRRLLFSSMLFSTVLVTYCLKRVGLPLLRTVHGNHVADQLHFAEASSHPQQQTSSQRTAAKMPMFSWITVLLGTSFCRVKDVFPLYYKRGGRRNWMMEGRKHEMVEKDAKRVVGRHS